MAGENHDDQRTPAWNPEWNELLDSYKDNLVARARFKGTFGKSPDLLSLMVSGESFSEAYSLEEWKRLVGTDVLP